MKSEFSVRPIGKVHASRGEFFIELEEKYAGALPGLDGFGHVVVCWWADRLDTPENRSAVTVQSPYRDAPAELGIFATRSPMRPNPIALSVCMITDINIPKGIIRLGWIDADNDTPVLDLKPYTPSAERVRNVKVPDWSRKWPSYLEDSALFDWTSVFNTAR